jgi:hypothetical protein
MHTEIDYKDHGPDSLHTLPCFYDVSRGFASGNLEKSLDTPSVTVEVHAALLSEHQTAITDAPFGFLSGRFGPKYFSNGHLNLAYVVLAQTSSQRRFKVLQSAFGDIVTTVAAEGAVVQRDPLQGLRGPQDYMNLLLGFVQDILEKGRKVSIHSYEQNEEQTTSPYLLKALEEFVSEDDGLCLRLTSPNP